MRQFAIPALVLAVLMTDGLPAQAVINIYTVSGQLVKTIRKDDITGTAFWYVDNDDGEKIATGLYIYTVQSGLRTGKGKLAIIR